MTGPVLVEVQVATDGGRRQARYVWDRGDVTALTTGPAGARVAGFRHDRWATALADLVACEPAPGPAPPPTELDLPFELAVGAGEAIRLRRDDVLAELLRRHGRGLDPDDVRHLHTGCRGRMLATAWGTTAAGRRRAGWVSWSLFADGWRALTPRTGEGVARIRVHRVEPPRLAVEVARLVTAVKA